ncbi:hypothetical protein B484DRAFT_408524 [Ochromonadaceae sp. CCMP2298]|nr:hypothetical protein B484DRAFT_408524 [Ochromonadaceae sp. CCMP2298]
MGLTPMQREYLSQSRDFRDENCYMATMYMHKLDAEKATFVEATIGQDSSAHAAELLKYIMLFINAGVVQSCADVVQPAMHNIDQVLQATVVNRTLLHEMI